MHIFCFVSVEGANVDAESREKGGLEIIRGCVGVVYSTFGMEKGVFYY